MEDWYMTQRAREAQDLWREWQTLREQDPDPFIIEGIYHPHLVDSPASWPIECSAQALGQSYLSKVGGFVAEVTMPRSAFSEGKALGSLAPPRFALMQEAHDWSRWTFPSEPRHPKWGSNRSKVAIRDFRIAVAPGDVEIEEACRAVYDTIGDWWRLVKSWIEMLSSQDLEGIDRFHWSSGSLSLWQQEESAGWRLVPDRSRIGTFWRPDMRFGPATNAICRAVHAAGCGHEVPLEWHMLREALRAFERGQYRRVLMECGIAAEVALRLHLTANRRPPEERATMGQLVSAAQKLPREHLIVPEGFYSHVVLPRNAVIHRGSLPDSTQAVTAFDLVMLLVEQASPRDRLREPYGLVVRTDPPVEVGQHASGC